jgi:predicted PurR-regulated permease PerM
VSSPEARSQAALAGRRSASLLIVATVAAGVALYFAQEIFIPIALGLVFTALLRPVVRALSRFRIPAPATATLVVLSCVGVFAASVFLFSRPVRAWVNEAPKTLAAARGKLEKLRRPIKQVSQAVEKVQKEVTGAEEKAKPAQAAAPASSPAIPAFVGRVFATTTGILGALLQTIVIVFLLLATGDLFTRKLAAVMSKPVTGTAESTVGAAEAVMRRYLIVTALINAGQGLVIIPVMMLIGMPNPALWGLLTFVFEFLPYIGALFMVVALSITGFATFDSLGHDINHSEQCGEPLRLRQRFTGEPVSCSPRCPGRMVSVGSSRSVRGGAAACRRESLCRPLRSGLTARNYPGRVRGGASHPRAEGTCHLTRSYL